MHVLLIRLSALGDVVHTLPAAALLRENLPDAKLTWVVEAPFAELLRDNSVVDDVIVFPKKEIAKELGNPLSLLAPSSQFRRFLEELRSRKVTASIDFQGLFKSGALGYLSGASVRVGFSQSRELSPLFLTHKLDAPDYFKNEKHVVLHNLELSEFYLRIAGGAEPKSRAISFPLPSPGLKTFQDVLALLNSESHGFAQDASATSDYGLAGASGASPIKEQPLPPQPEPAAEVDKAPRAKSDAAIGATASSDIDASSIAQTPDSISEPPSVSASQALSSPSVASTPNQESSLSSPSAAPTPPSVSQTLATSDDMKVTSGALPKVVQTQDWSMFGGSGVQGLEDPMVQEIIKMRRSAGETLIVLIPGTTWITKIWPREKWAGLVSRLAQLNGVRILLIGGPSEKEMNTYIYDRVCEQRNARPPLIDLTGKTTLRGLIALFSMADMVVGADTGPLHMACAVNVPHVIGIFGSTPWKRNGPIGAKSSVVALELGCQPCFEKTCPLKTLACLNDLDVRDVEIAIGRYLS